MASLKKVLLIAGFALFFNLLMKTVIQVAHLSDEIEDINCTEIFPASMHVANTIYWFVTRFIQSHVHIFLVYLLFRKKWLSKRKADAKKSEFQSSRIHSMGSEIDDII